MVYVILIIMLATVAVELYFGQVQVSFCEAKVQSGAYAAYTNCQNNRSLMFLCRNEYYGSTLPPTDWQCSECVGQCPL